MQLYIGSDHAGYEFKELLKAHLEALGHSIEDKGAFALNERDDYPDFIRPVAEAVEETPGSMGIVLGGSGQGEAMCANRMPGIRAAVYYGGSSDLVQLAREHNDANILSIGARFATPEEAVTAVDLFIATPFSNEVRHVRRLGKFN